MLISITEADIAAGIPQKAGHCPLAKALKRACRRDDVMVYPSYVYLGAPHRGAREVYLPREASRFVSDFDSGRPVQPLDFELPR